MTAAAAGSPRSKCSTAQPSPQNSLNRNFLAAHRAGLPFSPALRAGLSWSRKSTISRSIFRVSSTPFSKDYPPNACAATCSPLKTFVSSPPAASRWKTCSKKVASAKTCFTASLSSPFKCRPCGSAGKTSKASRSTFSKITRASRTSRSMKSTAMRSTC